MSDVEKVMAAAKAMWQERTEGLDGPPSTTETEFILAFVMGATWQVKQAMTRADAST